MRIRLAQTASLAVFAVTSLAAQATTVFSDDFSGGNPSAATSYGLIAAGSYSLPGQYRVVSDPSAEFTNGYVSYFDHTTGAAGGAMLFFDGAASPIPIWSQAASLLAGTTYSFSFFASSGGPLSTPTLNVLIDGVATGATASTTVGAWTQYTYAYAPASAGTHTFSIVDSNLEALGNDGALDDISLSTAAVAAVPEPSTVGLMLAGLVGLQVGARKRCASRGRRAS